MTSNEEDGTDASESTLLHGSSGANEGHDGLSMTSNEQTGREASETTPLITRNAENEGDNGKKSTGKPSLLNGAGTKFGGLCTKIRRLPWKVREGCRAFYLEVRSLSVKENKILLFIAIDFTFFLLELLVGSYYANSLALVADAFHMLNDIISLFVGFWAARAARNDKATTEYTYGRVRAELLGGFMNGVFLVALCLSIFLESIQRFVQPQKVKDPFLVGVIGGIGLLFNIIGLFVFHQHTHTHGEHDGHKHDHGDPINSVEPGHGITRENSNQQSNPNGKQGGTRTQPGTSKSDVENVVDFQVDSELGGNGSFSRPDHRNSLSSQSDLAVHPRRIRDSISHHAAVPPVIGDTDSLQYEQENQQPRSHGHSHGDMNMRGIFLHVVGDALGNIGVVISALIIGLGHGHGRYYADPAISLVITGILLWTAIPLCLATAKPLLQASPNKKIVEQLEKEVKKLRGVDRCHDVHVWALTPTKYIATLHVRFEQGFDMSDYMDFAEQVQRCSHKIGIHSTTVQPEFADLDEDSGQCLLNCDPDCDTGRQCCDSGKKSASGSTTPRP